MVDDRGEPVAAAVVTVGSFGAWHPTFVNPGQVGAGLPWFNTRTDEKGNYRFRGAILEDIASDIGVHVIARLHSGRGHYGGGSNRIVCW